jgi:hypothetical protein
MTPTFRSATAIAVTVGLAALLTACFPVGSVSEPTPSESAASTGLSREAAAELLNAVPGISSASVGSVISGLGSETVVKVSVDDQSSILADGVLDYVLQIGWATMVPNEPTELSLTVRSNGSTLDLQAQANDLAGVDSQSSPLPFSAYLDAPGDYLGAWPGAVPAPPAG